MVYVTNIFGFTATKEIKVIYESKKYNIAHVVSDWGGQKFEYLAVYDDNGIVNFKNINEVTMPGHSIDIKDYIDDDLEQVSPELLKDYTEQASYLKINLFTVFEIAETMKRLDNHFLID